MAPFRAVSLFSALVLLAPIASVRAATIGSCHPYPGAAAQDCLELIGNTLGNDTQTPCTNGVSTITLRNCAITTKCASGASSPGITNEDAVRRALTAIGFCALNDLGSISGSYTGDDNVETCYLYPGQ